MMPKGIRVYFNAQYLDGIFCDKHMGMNTCHCANQPTQCNNVHNI